VLKDMHINLVVHLQIYFTYKGTSINHPEGVRLLITRYKPKAQCR